MGIVFPSKSKHDKTIVQITVIALFLVFRISGDATKQDLCEKLFSLLP
jgi:hypothetical protein